MRQRVLPLICGASLLTFVGCAGKGEVVPIHVQPVLEKGPAPAKQNGLRVTVTSFEDARSDKTRLGVRTHLWGGESYFDDPGGKPGDVAADALSKYLAHNGWKVVPGGGAAGESDVILSGKVLDMTVHAKSGVAHTDLTARTNLILQAKNVADGSQVRLTLSSAGSDSVFWFEPEDVQTLVNEVLTDGFAKLIQDTTVQNNALRLR